MPVMVSVSEEGRGGPSGRGEVLGLPPGGQGATGGRDGNAVDSGGGTLAELGGGHCGHDPPGGGAAGTDLRRQALLGQHIGSNPSKIPSTSNKKVGTMAEVVQRNYALNDIGALRKKLNHELNKEQYSNGKEAKDGSCFTITMRASVFERVKEGFIEDLTKDNRITKISNGLAATATVNVGNGKAAVVTGNGSKVAIVEYSMDISFGKDEKAHTVKMTAYSTTSSIMLQPKGEKAELFAHLGGKCTPKYFAETFLLPWCEKEVSSKDFDPNKFVQAIKDEIKRLEEENGGKKLESPKQNFKRSKSIAELSYDAGKKLRNVMKEKSKDLLVQSKCSAKNCQYKGKVNINNKSAVGNCDKCGGYEHFVCLNLSPEEKEDFINGSSKFYCSGCFGANPLELSTGVQTKTNSSQSSKPEEVRTEAVLLEASLNDEKVELEEEVVPKTSVSVLKELEYNPFQTNAIVHGPQNNTSEYKCSKCEYTCSIENELKVHMDSQHENAKKQQQEEVVIEDEEDDSDEDADDDVFDGSDNENYYCLVCQFKNNSETVMENHVLENHIEKEEDGLYHCQEGCHCTFPEKNELMVHYQRVHKNKENEIINEDDTPEDELMKHFQLVQKNKEKEKTDDSPAEKQEDKQNENEPNMEELRKVKADLAALTRNFKRLEGMYHESLEEVNQVKSEYEAKLIAANDRFSQTKAQNETLREQVDILFKLGKSYLDQGKTEKNKSNKGNKNQTAENPDVIKVLAEDEIDLTMEDMITLSKNKISGYRKGNPSTQAIPNSSKKDDSRKVPVPSDKINRKQPDAKEDSMSEKEKQKTKDNFCHYFVNFGRCTFERRTGEKCKFEHKLAPECRYGSACKRNKCQYFHQKSQPFLGRHQAESYPRWKTPWLSPWQTSNTTAPQVNQHPPPSISPWQINPWQTVIPPWSPQMQEWPPLMRENRRNK